MELQIEKRRGRSIVKLIGELDHHACQEIRDTLDNILKTPATKALVMDMKAVTFMDSSGMGLLLARHRLALDRQVELVICGASVEITKLLCMVALDKQVPMFGNINEANEYLDKRGEQ